MNRNEMIENLTNGFCDIIFEKADGSERKMKATLYHPALSEWGLSVQSKPLDKVKPQNMNIIRAVDVDKKAWRSFRVDSVKSFTANGAVF